MSLLHQLTSAQPTGLVATLMALPAQVDLATVSVTHLGKDDGVVRREVLNRHLVATGCEPHATPHTDVRRDFK
jgi:hypothetical protein